MMTFSSKLLTLTLTMAFALPSWGNDCIEMHVITNPPMGYLDSNGNPTGAHWDYLTAIEQRSGICITKKLMPYARVWQSLDEGLHDGGIIFRSVDREHTTHPVALIRSLRTVVIPRENKPIHSYQDLSGLKIGKTRGTRLSDRFDNDHHLLKVELNDYAQAAKMIKRGRLDAIAGSGVLLNYHLEKFQIFNHGNISKGYTLGHREQWLQLSQKSKHLAKTPQLQQAIEQLRGEGVLDNIMTKYYGVNWRKINRIPNR